VATEPSEAHHVAGWAVYFLHEKGQHLSHT
jgi:hypothetical protein